jgi:chemotaxis regulatin CheY-phosphate phosphatase CheZ
MQDKDLRKLSRAELLELLISQTRRVEELEAQLADALAQLEKRQIAIDKAGTLAEASLMLNGVFEATEKAAAQYLENIERLSGQQQRVCDAMRPPPGNGPKPFWRKPKPPVGNGRPAVKPMKRL